MNHRCHRITSTITLQAFANIALGPGLVAFNQLVQISLSIINGACGGPHQQLKEG